MDKKKKMKLATNTFTPPATEETFNLHLFSADTSHAYFTVRVSVFAVCAGPASFVFGCRAGRRSQTIISSVQQQPLSLDPPQDFPINTLRHRLN